MVSDAPSRELRRMLAAAAAMLAVVLVGLAVVLGAVAQSIDAHQRTKEEQLVERRLTRTLDKISADITSATIWNDAVAAFDGKTDTAWMQVNFGSYYADYMQHEITLAYAPDGALIQVSRKSRTVPAASEAAFVTATAPLAAAVRAAARAKPPEAVGFAASVTRQAVIRAGDRLYLVVASNVVPEDGKQRRLARDPVVVSAKPFSAFLASLQPDLGLRNAVLIAPKADTRANGDGMISIRSLDGQALGTVRWTPERPGQQILRHAGPLMLAMMVALAIATTILFLRISANVRRLADSETELAAALARAETANIAKSRFLANMSHELRTPLNGVLTMAELLALGRLSAVQKQQLGLLAQSGRHLLAMIEHIFNLVRLESDAALERAPFEPTAILDSLAAQHRPAAKAKGLWLTVETEASGAWIGDAAHIRQALDYLIVNALNFTTRGGVRLRAIAEPRGLAFEVEDTGVGMTAEVMSQVFQPFSQGDMSNTRKVEGAGLGLTICRQLVERMQGRITVASQPGRGSTFRVAFPTAAVRDLAA